MRSSFTQAAQILVVDDEDLHRETLCINLGDLGLHCIPASNGVEAWEKLHSRVIDLVLTDNTMEPVSGLDLLRKIKTKPSLKKIPVILFTGNPEPTLLDTASRLGAIHLMVKPFSLNDVVEAIHKAIRKNEESG